MDAVSGLTYINTLKKDDFGSLSLILRYKLSNLNSSFFSRDLAELVLRGNAFFEGETADLSGFNYLEMDYQMLQVGLLKEKIKYGNRTSFGGVLSLNFGNNLLTVDAPRASLFTAVDGEYLELNLQLDAYKSDTSKTNFFDPAGIGLGADLFFQYEGDVIIRADIQDLGFISWSGNTIRYLADTMVRFDGVEANGLFTGGDSIFQGAAFDSLFDIGGVVAQNSSITTQTPATINIIASKQFENVGVTLGFRHRLFDNYRPLIYGKFHYPIKSIGLGTVLSAFYGGYGEFNMGIELSKWFNQRFGILLGTNSLLTFFSPNTVAGGSLFLLAAYSF